MGPVGLGPLSLSEIELEFERVVEGRVLSGFGAGLRDPELEIEELDRSGRSGITGLGREERSGFPFWLDCRSGLAARSGRDGFLPPSIWMGTEKLKFHALSQITHLR